MQTAPASPIIRLRHIDKAFGGTHALRDVSFDVARGHVHAVVGENGAGKSTLMKILAGVCRRDAGEILIDGEPAPLRSRYEARRAGVGIVYQEPSLCPDLSIAENVFLGREMPGWLVGTVDRQAAERSTTALLDRVHVEAPASTLVSRLSVAQRHLVQVARCLAFDLPIIIMDEPTASLSDTETETLFAIIRRLKADGVTVVYISHKLDEIFAIADRVTVLRDGRVVATMDVARTNKAEIVRRMVGRDVADGAGGQAGQTGEPVLVTQGLTRAGAFRDVSLRVRRGEVVTLAGLVGSGRTEVARVLFGLDRPTSGQVLYHGRPCRFRSPGEAVAAGVAMVPEDRAQHGLILDMAVSHNLSLPRVAVGAEGEDPVVGRWGVLRPSREAALAGRFVDRLRIKLAKLAEPARRLSGGNQQKVVIGKWLAMDPKLLILDEPTRGIDVGAKAGVHRLIRQLAAEGLAVLMISSELPEVLAVSDVIYVMHEGRITGTLRGCDATQERIMALATQ